MKQILCISILIIFSFSISCKNEHKPKKENFDFIKTYVGKIDNKYSLHMKLKSENGKIDGSYFYDKIGSEIKIKGKIADDSIILNEFDKNGNQTGLWKGKIVNENKIKGVWSKPNGKFAKDFTLILSSDNFESSKKAILDSKFSQYNGIYNSPFNDGGISFGRLIINYNQNGEIQFEITTAHQSGCVGELKGVAKILSNRIAKYSGKGCKSLIFKFNKNEVIVTEKDCDYHGMRCYFSGKYIK